MRIAVRPVILATLLGTPALAAEPPRYAVTVIGGVSSVPAGPVSLPLALNNNGRIVGYGYTGTSFQTLNWKEGILREMTGLGDFTRTFANSVNIRGRVVGAGIRTDPNTGQTETRALKWTGGVISDLGTLGGSIASALSINDHETIVGYSTLPGDTIIRAFIHQNGAMSALPTLPGAVETYAYDIANTGYIAGAVVAGGPARPVLWVDSSILPLPIPASARTGAANAVNNAGVAVGAYELSEYTGAFAAAMWQNGALIDLGNLGGPAPYAVAEDINNAGHVVGTSLSPSGLAGFLYFDGRMYDLRDLLLAGPGSLQITAALAINDHGQIAAAALVNGQQTAVLLSPIVPNVPAPATVALLAAAGIVAFRRRR